MNHSLKVTDRELIYILNIPSLQYSLCHSISSVPNRPGQPKGRTAVFEQDGGPYRVRHVSSGQGGWTAGNGRGWLRAPGTAGDSWGRHE